jgi:hypothetical protein
LTQLLEVIDKKRGRYSRSAFVATTLEALEDEDAIFNDGDDLFEGPSEFEGVEP